MPGNIIQINYSKDLEWYVGDSGMEDLISYLNEMGYRITKDSESTSSDTSS